VSDRRIRFGFQISGEHVADPVAAARRAEELGFDIVLVSDHVGPGLAPLPTLAAIAQGTERIRIGTLVLNHDMRNPVQLAWEATTLDRLSGGRFELGLGAGHTPQEYEATGIAFDPPRVRKERLMAGVEIIRRLLDGATVDVDGTHHRLTGAAVRPALQERLPIMVGGNGEALLAHAGAHADIVGLQGLGRTLPDGHAHEARWTAGWLDTQVAQVQVGAAGRSVAPELSALVQVVDVTDDRSAALARVCEQIGELDPADAAATPYVLAGTVDEIVDHVRTCAGRWGITYYTVRSLEEMGPVVAAFE